jgi:actin-related protein
MFKDFGRRLQRDIKRTVDNRIKRSEELSGGKLKATPPEVKVISHHMQRYAVWFGGSMLASTVCSNSIFSLSLSLSSLSLSLSLSLLSRKLLIRTVLFQ